MVTVLELFIFIQKVLWLKLLWFGEFLAVIQEGVQCRNYDCALEGTEAALVSQVNTTQAFTWEPAVEFYVRQDGMFPTGEGVRLRADREQVGVTTKWQ